MDITYVGGQVAGRANSSGALSVTFALTGGSDATPQEFDLVIVTAMFGSAAMNTAMAVTTPSGYTALGQLNQSAVNGDTSMDVSYKFMGFPADTTVTIPGSASNSNGQCYSIQVFRGVDRTTPLDVAAIAAGATGTGRPDPGSITPTTTGAWVVICGGSAVPSPFPAALVAPAGYETNFLAATGSDTTSAMLGSGYKAWTSGAEDPAQYTGGTTGANDSWCAYTIALRPAATDPPSAPGRVTQANAEVLSTATPPVRHTQVGVEVLATAAAPARHTQVGVEVLATAAAVVRHTQVGVEVLWVRTTVTGGIWMGDGGGNIWIE